MVRRLTDRQVKYAIREYKKGRKTSDIAQEIKTTQRHVQRLLAEYKRTGRPHEFHRPGRRPVPITEREVDLVTKRCRVKAGVQRTARVLRAEHDISYGKVYKIMKDIGRVVPSPAKSKRRKWIRFERLYSNAMWHVDWHEMKDPRFRGLNLVTYLDDSSRCVTGAGLFKEATSENAVLVLREAVQQFGTPATILSDNGSCFVGRGGRKKGGKKAPKGSWKPTAFESELIDLGVDLINSRPYHPQTNGKLERFFGTVEAEIRHHQSMSGFVAYYNEERLHFSLDIDNLETPLRAFSSRKATKAIRKNDPQWMEADRLD